MANEQSLTVDGILSHIGEYGRFQQILDVILLVMRMPASAQVLLMTFSVLTSEWKCKENSTICRYNGTFPFEDERRCDLLRSSWYYTKDKEFSLVTQFDIHCQYKWILQLISSISFVSWGIGAIVLGWFGDRFGRKVLMFPSYGIVLFVGFISAFMPNIYLIITCRFVIGFFLHGALTQGYIIISEVVGNKHRPFACLILFLSSPIAWGLIGLQAYYLQNWKILSITISAPYIVMLAFYKIVPESIQWLSLHGKVDKAISILRRIGEWNKKKLPMNLTISEPQQVQSKSNILDLFRTRKLAVRSMLLFIVWVVTAMNYYGIFMATNDLGGSIYRDFVLLSLGDIPALFISMYLCDRVGRKMCSVVPLSIGGVCCIGIGFIPINDNCKVYRIILGNVGKLFTTVAFNGVYTWTVELYSTNIRSTGLGFTTVAGRIGSAAASWVVIGLKPFGNWCPFMALGVPPLIGSLVGLVLPETKEKVAPESNKVVMDDTDCIKDKENSKGIVNVSYDEPNIA